MGSHDLVTRGGAQEKAGFGGDREAEEFRMMRYESGQPMAQENPGGF